MGDTWQQRWCLEQDGRYAAYAFTTTGEAEGLEPTGMPLRDEIVGCPRPTAMDPVTHPILFLLLLLHFLPSLPPSPVLPLRTLNRSLVVAGFLRFRPPPAPRAHTLSPLRASLSPPESELSSLGLQARRSLLPTAGSLKALGAWHVLTRSSSLRRNCPAQPPAAARRPAEPACPAQESARRLVGPCALRAKSGRAPL